MRTAIVGLSALTAGTMAAGFATARHTDTRPPSPGRGATPVAVMSMLAPTFGAPAVMIGALFLINAPGSGAGKLASIAAGAFIAGGTGFLIGHLGGSVKAPMLS